MLCWCAISEISFMSVTFAAGFPIDSQKINLVFSSIIFSRPLRSLTLPKRASIPIFGKVSLNKLTVPPYNELVETILSPFEVIFRIAAVTAAIPDEKASPPTPPSISETLFSKTSVVGFIILV